jgi:hypothetical protein
MTRIAGLKTVTTTTGKIKSVTVDMKKWGHLMEDVLDSMAAEKALQSNDYTPWETVKKRLDKKHRVR